MVVDAGALAGRRVVVVAGVVAVGVADGTGVEVLAADGAEA